MVCKKREMYQNALIETKMAIIPYFSVQSGILVQLLSASWCGDCKVQEIWDSTCVISGIIFQSDKRMPYN